MYSTLRKGQAEEGRSKRLAGCAHAAARQHTSPQCLADTLNWASEVLPRILANKYRRTNFLDNCRMGLHVESLFSGVGTAEDAAHALVDDVQRHGFKDIPAPTPGTSCDSAQESQMVLLNMGDVSPCCVFQNIEDRVGKEHMDEIARLQPNFQVVRQSLKGAPKGVRKNIMKENVARMKLVAEYLEKHAGDIFKQGCKSPCVKHNKLCDVTSAPPSSFHVCVLGSVCVAWSSRGLSEGVVHESFLALLIAVQSILSALPLLVLHECVPNFPVIILRSLLGHKYRLIIFPEVSPRQLGHPVERTRQYILLVLLDHVVCTASVEQFYELFFRELLLDGDIYFVASPEMLQRVFKAKALKRNMSDTAPCRELDTVGAGVRWAEHEDYICAQREKGELMDSNLFWDNAHHLSFSAKPTPFIPTLTRNSQIASLAADRRAIGVEHLLMQGICAQLVPGVTRPSSWRHLVQHGTLTENEIVSLAGNAMHQAVVGALLGYALSTCTRVASPSPHAERPSLSSSHAEAPASSSAPAENDDSEDVVFMSDSHGNFWDRLLAGDT